MQFERDSVVARLQVDLERRVRLPDRRSTKEDLHQLLLEVALESVSLDDIDQPAILTRERLKSLPTVEHFPRIVEMIDEHQDTVVERLLQILIYQAQEETEYYRLPHNEYRDFLLADGIFRWCEGKNGPLIDSQPAFQSRLVTTYLQLENVRNLFLPQIIAKRLGVNRRHFIDDFVMRMNGALQETKPANRTDSSAHAAALSFLMTINPPRNIHVIAKDRNFQRAWIERSEGRVRLPLGKDCTNAIFREARLPCAELSECNFDGADFDNADLTGASLSRSTFRKANLQNVAMGKSGTRETVLRGGDFAGSNWFNYRFQGIRGYFHFWDLEILNSRFVLAAGSRGQILMFDLTEAKLVPQQLLTTHDNNEIMDISRHPIEHDVIVTTCRDRTIRLFRITMFPQPLLTQIAHLSGLFQEDYPRRAQFSKSGNWLAIIARDSQVKFVPVGEGFRIDPGEVSVGRVHTGPVMCVAEEIEERVNQAEKNWDSFYTGGYDGRIAMWQDGDTRRPKDIWAKPVAITNSLRAKDGRTEIYRALAPNAERMGIWAGTEIDGSLQLIEFSGRSASVDIGLSHVFNEGIFSLAVHPETGQIAVGFGTGRVRVYRVMNPSQKDRYDWNRPVLDIETNGEIVRSLVFIESGNVVLAATWDACLYRFDLRAGRETDHYEYPSAGWMPEIDTDCFDFGTEDEAEALLRDVRGVSPRMKQYLVLVAKAKDRECQTRSRT